MHLWDQWIKNRLRELLRKGTWWRNPIRLTKLTSYWFIFVIYLLVGTALLKYLSGSKCGIWTLVLVIFVRNSLYWMNSRGSIYSIVRTE
jgi:hypothetical protein